MCLFALFAHSGPPLKVLAAMGLCLTALSLYTDLMAHHAPGVLLGLDRFSKRTSVFTAFGVVSGCALGLVYRWAYDMPPFPAAFGLFAPAAVLIGATEEVLYRGYIQGRMRRFGPLGAAAFASLCHSAYKCALFLLHNQPVDIDLWTLGMLTFAVGLGFGMLRERSGSLLPSIAAHGMFDLIAYGGYARAPWWVWS